MQIYSCKYESHFNYNKLNTSLLRSLAQDSSKSPLIYQSKIEFEKQPFHANCVKIHSLKAKVHFAAQK